MRDFIAFVFISLLGAMSPGADFAIVVRFAVSGSRISALAASLGIASALFIHVSLCLLGIGLFLLASPNIFRAVQIMGSLYLAYLGIKLIRSKIAAVQVQAVSKKHAFLAGFLTNLMNPKATLFVLSLFTQFFSKTTPMKVQLGYGMVMCFIALMWFCGLSCVMTHKKALPHLQKYQLYFNRVMGVVLCLLAIYIILN